MMRRTTDSGALRAGGTLTLLACLACAVSCMQPATSVDNFDTGGRSTVTGDEPGQDETGSVEDDENADPTQTSDARVGTLPPRTSDAGKGSAQDAGAARADAGSRPDPVPTDPVPTDPVPTDPVPTDPVPTDPAPAATLSKLSFGVTTSSPGGQYSPRNIYAIWVVDSQGKFVKTLAKFARTRAVYLSGWNAASRGNVVDAVTGATMSGHGQRMASWDLTDAAQQTVPDGEYQIVLEMTDADRTGVTARVPFTKGGSAMRLTPANQSNFTNMSLVLE